MSEETRQLDRSAARDLRPGEAHYSAYVGPAKQWDFMGATQFRLLTALGLREHHKLLDVGCGGLRAGRLLIPYLNFGNYCGIEPNTWLVDDAIAAEIGADTIARKGVRFHESAEFDAGYFGEAFDFIVAQSIFSHAGPDMVGPALQKFAAALAAGGLVLATFIETDLAPKMPCEAPGWTYPGCITFRASTITDLAAAAGLVVRRLPWFHPRQSWYALARHTDDLPSPKDDRHLTGAVLRDPDFKNSLRDPS